MKPSKFSAIVASGLIAASLGIAPLTLPASAQTDTYTTPRQDVLEVEEDNDFDWGWLGLLGLIGLAGLAGRKRHEPVARYDYEREREPDATRSGYPR